MIDQKRWVYGLLLKILPVYLILTGAFFLEAFPGGRCEGSFPGNLYWTSDLLQRMSREEKVGQLFMVAFRQEDGQPVQNVTQAIEKKIRERKPGGVILFAENFRDREQTQQLTAELQRTAGAVPLLIGVDQEGGRVIRISYGTSMPGNMALGAANSSLLARQVGFCMGRELKELGINVNFAPVLDVNINPDNPVIGVRSFGSDPLRVGELGCAYMQGLHDAGILSAVKHFPGHGDTSVDSHLGLPRIEHDWERLLKVELAPFRQAIAQGTDLVMTGHVVFSALEPEKAVSRWDGTEIQVPATLSGKVLTDLLRQQMNYDGIVITDAMEMKAITTHFGSGEAAVKAFCAGADMILMPADWEEAYQALLQAIESGYISEERLNQSVGRILAAKEKLMCAMPVGVDEKALSPIDVEMEAARKGTTLVQKGQGKWPFEGRDNGDGWVFVVPGEERLKRVERAWREVVLQAGIPDGEQVKGFSYTGKSSELPEVEEAVRNARGLVIMTCSYNVADRTMGTGGKADFVKWVIGIAEKSGTPRVVMMLGVPYDIEYLSLEEGVIGVYGDRICNIKAGLEGTFGLIRMTGKLPVAISLK